MVRAEREGAKKRAPASAMLIICRMFLIAMIKGIAHLLFTIFPPYTCGRRMIYE
jgi:hypothetical protein